MTARTQNCDKASKNFTDIRYTAPFGDKANIGRRLLTIAIYEYTL